MADGKKKKMGTLQTYLHHYLVRVSESRLLWCRYRGSVLYIHCSSHPPPSLHRCVVVARDRKVHSDTGAARSSDLRSRKRPQAVGIADLRDAGLHVFSFFFFCLLPHTFAHFLFVMWEISKSYSIGWGLFKPYT